MKLLLCAAIALTMAGSVMAEGEPWRSRLTPDVLGPFPQNRDFEGEFRFGWSEIEAATAKAKLTSSGDDVTIAVEGGTSGLARKLWQLDATHTAYLKNPGLHPVYFRQHEKYAKRTITTEAAFKPDVVWRFRKVDPDPGKTPKWKKMKIKPVRDIVSAMLFIRSQPLNDKDEVVLIAFPGDTPYLVDARVLGREEIKVSGVKRKAIKLDFKLEKIDVKAGGKLSAHGKFRKGTVWISDDADRFPLRAEVEIFIGYVFGELKSVTFKEVPTSATPPEPANPVTQETAPPADGQTPPVEAANASTPVAPAEAMQTTPAVGMPTQ